MEEEGLQLMQVGGMGDGGGGSAANAGRRDEMEEEGVRLMQVDEEEEV